VRGCLRLWRFACVHLRWSPSPERELLRLFEGHRFTMPGGATRTLAEVLVPTLFLLVMTILFAAAL
jgi:hypothetical protein